MAGMRRSDVSALCWADVVDSTDGDGMLVCHFVGYVERRTVATQPLTAS